MRYSKSTGGFYTTEIHGDAIPADAVEITPEFHAELLAGQSAGKIIVAGNDGNPVLQDAPPLSKKQLNDLRASEIKAELDSLDAKSIRPLREGDTNRTAAIEAQAAALRSELAAL